LWHNHRIADLRKALALDETTKQARGELARELLVAARRLRTRLDERLRPLGVGEARWAALCCLRRSPLGLTQTALAEQAGVESPTLVRTLDLLCAAGLVERRGAPNDRRSKLVVLRAGALPLLERLDAAAADLRQEVMADLTPEEIAVTLRVLAKLRRGLDGPAGVAPASEARRETAA
jgi:MarR family transcriptional regulator for hemolysin